MFSESNCRFNNEHPVKRVFLATVSINLLVHWSKNPKHFDFLGCDFPVCIFASLQLRDFSISKICTIDQYQPTATACMQLRIQINTINPYCHTIREVASNFEERKLFLFEDVWRWALFAGWIQTPANSRETCQSGIK